MRRGRGRGALRFRELRSARLPRRNDHGFLELVLFLLVGLLIGEAELVMTDGNDIAMLQRMLLDQLAVDVGAIGAVQILEKGIVQDVDDEGVVAADGRIVDPNVVIRQPPDGVALLRHVVFSQHLAVQTQN